MDLKPLIKKYSKPGPRYTSYPTAPQWTEDTGADTYERELIQSDPNKPLALYLHIPFCESLCYYCGCNIKITHDTSVASPYVSHLLQEAKTVARLLGKRRNLTQISWGGGTPTFLTPVEITRLHEGIRELFDIDNSAEVSIEIDPRVTSSEQLHRLSELGFNRVSLGVQDFDPEVQKAVNRVQSLELTRGMLQEARSLGFKGINFDLIYGLPFQSVERFQKTIDSVVEIQPDRIALYNYAHLPSLRPHQKILEKFPMPDGDQRVAIFELAYQALISNGYIPIGMDHFARGDDELALALSKGTLYRNFMGYTVKRGTNLIGLGASAIGELENGFFQNVRETNDYEKHIADSGLAVFRGCLFSPEDRERKWVIQRLMCQFRVPFDEFEETFKRPFAETYAHELSSLEDFYRDGLLSCDEDALNVSDQGRMFVRNAAMIFDAYLSPTRPQKVIYSKTV